MHKILPILLYFILLCALPAHAQVKDKPMSAKDSIKVATFTQNAEKLKKSGKYQEAIAEYQKASGFLKGEGYLERHFATELIISNIFGVNVQDSNKEEKILKGGIEEMNRLSMQKNLVFARYHLNLLTNYSFQRNQEKSLEYFKKAKNLFSSYHKNNKYIIAVYATFLMPYSLGWDEFNKLDSIQNYFIENYTELKKIYPNDENNKAFFNYYEQRGNFYINGLQNYKQGLEYLLKANDIFENALSKDKSPKLEYDYLKMLMSMASCYGNIKEFEKGIEKGEKCIAEIMKKGFTSPIENLAFYTNLANLYYQAAFEFRKENTNKTKNYLSRAKELYLKSIEICGNNQQFDGYLAGNIYPNFTQVLVMQKNYEEAKEYMRKSEAKLMKFYKGKIKNYDFAYLNLKYGEILEKNKEHEEALKKYQKSLYCLIPSFKDTVNVYKNPIFEVDFSINPEFLLFIFIEKSTSFANWSIQAKNKDYLKEALKNCEAALQLYGYLLKRKQDIDKVVFAEKYESIYGNLLSICYELKDFNKIFHYTEKYKANLLLAEALKNEKMTNIDTKIIDFERNLKKDILELEAELAKNENDNDLKDKRFKRNLALDSLVNVYQKQYPDYYKERYAHEVISLEKLQNRLKKDECLIEYVTAIDYLHINAITKDSIYIKQINITKDSLETKINLHRKILQESGKADSLLRLTMDLHQILITPILANVRDKTRWYVVPDKALFEINFDFLFEKLPKNTTYLPNGTVKPTQLAWDKIDYLLQKYIISNHLSATLIFDTSLNKKEAQPASRQDIMLVAPVYATDEGSMMLATNASIAAETASQKIQDTQSRKRTLTKNGKRIEPLLASKNEVNAIKTLFEKQGKTTTLLLEKDATEANVKSQTLPARILHLSTHSFFHARDYRLSAVSFWQPDSLAYYQSKQTNKPIEDGFLFMNEILNMDLPHTDLVVLSSCEGGVGKIVSGEGPMSLTYAFLRVGVYNLLYSLHKVPDEDTAELMPMFYKHLLAGKGYAEALNVAKKEFIKKWGAKASPERWSSFVVMER